MTSEWLTEQISLPSAETMQIALARQAELTKPAGSLGQLEGVAVQLAAMQQRQQPAVERVQIAIFAADHGVACEGVSAFPQEVTGQMLLNFAAGGAAISVLAQQLGAGLELYDVGTIDDRPTDNTIIDRRAGAGTANLRIEDAMSSEQLSIAMDAGSAAVQHAVDSDAELFIGGDMGIANTTAAAAIGCALLTLSPQALAGPGTGLDSAGVSHKAAVIADAVARMRGDESPLEILRRLGGFEIAALTGAYIRCAQLGLPVLVDGYITTAAALVAVRHQPAVAAWLLFSHRSAEPGHRAMLEALKAEPLLDLGMRLGEGSGAATAVPLLRLACALHNGMATFTDAGVAGETS